MFQLDFFKYYLTRFVKAEKLDSNHFKIPTYQMHRGFHLGGLQENSLAAILEAQKLNSKMCEVDIRITKDQIPVIFHDKDLSRFSSDESKKNLLIADLYFSDLKKIVPVISLEELLLNQDLKLYFNLEIKSEKVNDSIVRHVSDIVKKTKSSNRIIFSSFNPVIIWMLSHYLPSIPRALLVSSQINDENKWYLRNMILAPLLKVHFLNLDQEFFKNNDRSYSDWIFKLNIPIVVWTVNDKQQATSLINRGAVSIISDHNLNEG